MTRFAALTCFLVSFLSASVFAQQTRPKGLEGTWVRVTDEATIRMDIRPKAFTVTILVEGKKLSVTSDYAISEEHILYGRVVSFLDEAKVGGPEKGLLFSFRVRKDAKRGIIEIDQLRGSDMVRARDLIHGTYYFAPKTRE